MTRIRVPELPETVDEAIVGAWLKKVGDAVTKDETLVELETDKVVLEVPSQVAGVVSKIQSDAGDVVVEGQILAFIDEKHCESGLAEASQSEDASYSSSPSVLADEGLSVDADFVVPSRPRETARTSSADSVMSVISTSFVVLAFVLRYVGGMFVFALFIYGLFVLFTQSIATGLMMVGASMLITFVINVLSWFLLSAAGAK